MSFHPERFRASVPASWKSVYEILTAGYFVPTLVGGVVRDYFLYEKMGHDWDIEITHPTAIFDQHLWKELGKEFQRLGKTSFLPYDVIRLEIGPFQYEFSPPRVEIFPEDWNQAKHKNFVAEFDFKAPFEKSVLRRDFTINAMGLRFHSEKNIEHLDPLGGLPHLRDKLLYACSPDFIKDPVRFLRALRFSHKLGFALSNELKTLLEQMPVAGASPSYLWSEMQKSGDPLGFYQLLLAWVPVHPELSLPVGTELLNKSDELKIVLMNPTLHESWLVALAWVGIANKSWQSYFSLSSESSRRLARWAETSQKFTQLMPETFHGEFEMIRELPEFDLLFDWYFTTKQLLQKNTALPLLEMIGKYLPEWIYLYQFEVVKDVKHIDPPFRAKYQVWNLCQRL